MWIHKHFHVLLFYLCLVVSGLSSKPSNISPNRDEKKALYLDLIYPVPLSHNFETSLSVITWKATAHSWLGLLFPPHWFICKVFSYLDYWKQEGIHKQDGNHPQFSGDLRFFSREIDGYRNLGLKKALLGDQKDHSVLSSSWGYHRPLQLWGEVPTSLWEIFSLL